ncbi:MAG TPA: phosphatase PAP2 family protein [Actinomycetota bacterium]|nr:phosphatase PAP2 family protein [Actinomycetota bacterium]
MNDPRRAAERRFRLEAPLIVAAIAVFAFTTAPALDGVPSPERWVFVSINGLAGWLEAPIHVVMTLGLMIAVPIAAGIAFLLRHPRAGTAIGVAGISAYLIAKVGKDVVARGRPLTVFADGDVIARGAVQSGLGFPSGHAAVSTAIVCAVIPFLRTPWRWALLIVPVLVSFGRIYVGAHLPLDVVGGAAIGLFCASLYHLVISRPAVRGADVEEPQATSEPALGGPRDAA